VQDLRFPQQCLWRVPSSTLCGPLKSLMQHYVPEDGHKIHCFFFPVILEHLHFYGSFFLLSQSMTKLFTDLNILCILWKFVLNCTTRSTILGDLAEYLELFFYKFAYTFRWITQTCFKYDKRQNIKGGF
jgi:hypothetical protein